MNSKPPRKVVKDVGIVGVVWHSERLFERV
jgi:hypothetical protein